MNGNTIMNDGGRPVFARTLAAVAVFLALGFAFEAEAKVDVLCVYYPHWHVYPKGNEWFHPGWTEQTKENDKMKRTFIATFSALLPRTHWV